MKLLTVLDEMLGEKMLSPDSSEEEIQAVFKENYLEDENQQEICWLLLFCEVLVFQQNPPHFI